MSNSKRAIGHVARALSGNHIFFEFTDKLLHGVSPLVGCGFGTSNNVHLRRSAKNRLRLATLWGRLVTCSRLLIGHLPAPEKMPPLFAAYRFVGQTLSSVNPAVS
jgi:hypothetical protein